MRKNTNIILAILGFLILFLSPGVKAASKCDTKKVSELNREVANIKITYEIVEEMYSEEDINDAIVLPDDWNGAPGVYPTYKYIKVNIANLSDNFYITIGNNRETITNEDAVDGIVSLEMGNLSEVHKYEFNVYTSENTECADELFRKIPLTLPRYNDYSEFAVCSQMPDFYLCQPFVTFDEVDFSVFDRYVGAQLDKINEEYYEQEKEKEEQKNKNILKKYWYIFLIIGILAIGGVSTVIVVKKRNDNGGSEI